MRRFWFSPKIGASFSNVFVKPNEQFSCKREQTRTWAGVLQNAPTISPYCLNSQHATAAAAATLSESTPWCMGMRTV